MQNERSAVLLVFIALLLPQARSYVAFPTDYGSLSSSFSAGIPIAVLMALVALAGTVRMSRKNGAPCFGPKHMLTHGNLKILVILSLVLGGALAAMMQIKLNFADLPSWLLLSPLFLLMNLFQIRKFRRDGFNWTGCFSLALLNLFIAMVVALVVIFPILLIMPNIVPMLMKEGAVYMIGSAIGAIFFFLVLGVFPLFLPKGILLVFTAGAVLMAVACFLVSVWEREPLPDKN